jgi:hypothetical protein
MAACRSSGDVASGALERGIANSCDSRCSKVPGIEIDPNGGVSTFGHQMVVHRLGESAGVVGRVEDRDLLTIGRSAGSRDERRRTRQHPALEHLRHQD